LIPKWKRDRDSNRPRLLKALQKNSVAEVRAVLEQRPEDLKDFFFDNDFEPVLCCATRLGCSTNIMTLLLEANASPEAVDVQGRTPLMLASEPPPVWQNGLRSAGCRQYNLNFLPLAMHEEEPTPIKAYEARCEQLRRLLEVPRPRLELC
jgi:hypothetical protein